MGDEVYCEQRTDALSEYLADLLEAWDIEAFKLPRPAWIELKFFHVLWASKTTNCELCFDKSLDRGNKVLRCRLAAEQ